MKKLLLAFSILLSAITTYAQVAPDIYWQFEGATPLKPAVGPAANTISFGGAYSIDAGGPVGKYLTESVTGLLAQAGTINATSAISFQFIFKPGRNFSKTREASVISLGSTAIAFSYPSIIVQYSTGAGVNQYFDMDKCGIATWKTIMDGNWHHVAVVLNAAGGTLSLWLDGQSPAVFNVTIPTGTIYGGTQPIYYATTVDYTQFAGSVDEVAVYINKAISGNQIYKNYQDYLAGNHYTTALAASVPTPQATTAGYDPYEYVPGYPSSTLTVMQQLDSFPGPRYKPIATPSDSLLPIYSCADPYYLGRAAQGVAYATAVLNGVNANNELALKYNWVLSCWGLGQGLFATDTTSIQGKSIARYKSNKKLKLQGVTFRAQLSPIDKLPCDFNQPYITSCPIPTAGKFCYPTYYYLQNSSGQYIDPNGNVTTNRKPRPSFTLAQSYSNFPDTAMNQNGDSCASAATRISTALGSDLNFFSIWENGEDYTQLLDGGMNADPVVYANRLASGLTNRQFQGTWRARQEITNYRDRFIGTTTSTDSTLYSEYQNQGNPDYFFDWAYMRLVHTAYRNIRLSTADFYVRTPNQWYYANGANHGLRWMMNNQPTELGLGDILNSPFVSAGWDGDEHNNVSPPQWLGLMKVLATMGAETYYASVFTLFAGNDPDPINYIWAMVAPSYAQAITSRYERILHAGYLLQGDLPQVVTSQSGTAAYQFNTGDFRNYCVVRKDSSSNKYIIASNLNRNNNIIGNTEDSCVRYITLNDENLTFTTKQQGSVYVYDNTNTSNKIFYQLDKWHEKTHPYYWSRDFIFEAEVNDNTLSNQQVPLKTDRRNGAATGDYVNSTTYITYADSTTVLDTIRFNFQPRSTQTYYFWIRLRSRTGTTTGVDVKLNATTSKTINCVKDTGWYFYRLDGCVSGSEISYATTPGDYHLGILPINKYVQIDQVILTTDPNASYPEVSNPCGAVTATITPSGATTFCTGASVTLTANVNSAYRWSTGATTQAIVVVTSGNYTVQVTDGTGCTGVSAVEVVTVNTAPSVPSITVTGSTTICSGSTAILTSSVSPSTYLWSTGATTQAITVSTASTFTVTVSDASGCSASSNPVTTTVAALPGIPTITPTGATTFCQGGSVLLTSSAENSYLWTTGATSQAITVLASGTYTVTVTNTSGCTRSSAGTVVTVDTPPIIATISPVTNVCPATSVDLDTISISNSGTAVSTQTYHNTYADAVNDVSPQSNIASATKTYYTRFTTAAGCYDIKTIGVTIVDCACVTPPTADAGPDQSICAGSTSTMAGTIGGSATTGTWTTSGTGTFSSSTSMTAVYTPSVADTVAGVIQLTLTTDNPSGAPCVADSNVMTLFINPHPTVTLTPSGTVSICSGTATILSASVNNNYIWSTGATTQTISTVTAGNYLCTVTNSYGCTNVSATKTVTVLSVPTTPVITGTTTFCSGGSTTITSPVASAYLWSTGATTRAISVSASGNYTVTVSNASGCTASGNVSISQVTTPTTPTITPLGPTTFCTGGSVTLFSSIADSYLWSNGSTAQSIIVTTTGTFTVTVTINGCTATSASVSTTLGVSTKPLITPQASTICTGQTIVLASSVATSYLWSTGETTQSVNVTTVGSYIVTVTSALGCTSVSDAAIITSGSTLKPVITINGSASFCADTSRILTCNAATSYAWSIGATTASITVSTAGTYVVTVSDAYGCTATATRTVTVKSSPVTPTITAEGPLAICIGGRVGLTTSTHVSYLWSNAATTQQIIAKTPAAYIVTVTNSLGCTASSASKTVTVDSGCTSTCGIVTGVAVKLITKTGATLYWDQNNANTTYKVYLVNTKSGATRSGSYGEDIRETVYTNLNKNTEFRGYVIGKCGTTVQDTSNIIYFKTKK